MIAEIKELYADVKEKTKFIESVANEFERSPQSLRNYWFGGFWRIPDVFQDRVIEILKETIALQQ